MCNHDINIPSLLEEYETRLNALVDLHSVTDQLRARDRDFANDLYSQFVNTGGLSPRQWPWVQNLLDRVKTAEPIYGDFTALWVMFRLVGDKLQKPRIRLMTNWRDPEADHRFVQLTFTRDRDSQERIVEVHVDGWSGHGYRKFAGWVHEDKIVPWSADRMTDEVRTVIQDFSLDPARCSLASANLIGACVYCGNRLTDDDSKAVGYGPTCAHNYEMPYGPKASAAAKKALAEAQAKYKRY